MLPDKLLLPDDISFETLVNLYKSLRGLGRSTRKGESVRVEHLKWVACASDLHPSSLWI
jgi:hypothetical protein